MINNDMTHNMNRQHLMFRQFTQKCVHHYISRIAALLLVMMVGM